MTCIEKSKLDELHEEARRWGETELVKELEEEIFRREQEKVAEKEDKNLRCYLLKLDEMR